MNDYIKKFLDIGTKYCYNQTKKLTSFFYFYVTDKSFAKDIKKQGQK